MPPAGRRALFLGDLVDRGPAIPAVLRLVMAMVSGGAALCIPGNHEVKLLRALNGKNVAPTHGLAQSLEQLDAEPPEFSREVANFIDSLVGHYVLDEGRLVVANAGLPEKLQGRASGQVRAVALYGDTSGETDDYGLPARCPWAEEYRGKALVVYGHTPVRGRLSALRYPERELVSVPAHEIYYEPVRPLVPPDSADNGNRASNDLDLDDVVGKRIIETRLAQPGIKCRGREYLRIIYGAEYTAERNLSRLRSRGLGLKRSLAQREFALGIEALERFTAGEPLYRVHECVFGVLALESEPVDPRL
jgi:protein phosphatase